MQKNKFTLLELMVCLAIVAMVASVIGWQIKGSLDAARFKGSVYVVKQEIEKLQMLALTFSSDMQLEIRKEGDKYVMVSTTDEAVLKKLNGKKTVLEGVAKVTWNKRLNVKPLYLNILSNGRIPQRGVLGLHQEDRGYFLDMGAPIQIKFTQKYSEMSQPPKMPEKPKKSDEVASSGI